MIIISSKYPEYFELKSIHKLKEHAKNIIAKSSSKTLSALFLSLVSLFLILFGSMGLVNSICNKMFKETGIRLTVGAKDSDIIIMILSKILVPSILGIIVSLVAILLFNLSAQNYQSIIYFIPVTLLLIAIIAIASLIPLKKLIKGSVSDFINNIN